MARPFSVLFHFGFVAYVTLLEHGSEIEREIVSMRDYMKLMRKLASIGSPFRVEFVRKSVISN